MKKIGSIVVTMLCGVMNVHAIGTDYGVDVNNAVTLSYTVGGISQTTVNASDGGFKVDRKVDALVATTDATNIGVVPNDNSASDTKFLTFTVKNETNGAQDYVLSVSNLANGSNSNEAGQTDNVDYSTDLKVCTDITCSGGDISGTNVSFIEDEIKTFYVFVDIPAAASNGQIASIALTATAVDDGTTTTMSDDSGNVDDPAVVQIVFADDAGDASGDAAHDGKHSALSAYKVVTAAITATKTSCVIWDPVSLTSNPKRIPGAVIRYAVGVNNAGSVDATSVSVADPIQADLTYGTSAPAPVAVARIATEACDCTNPGASNGDTVTAVVNVVTANFGTITAGTDECAYFDVTVN